jgi:hypothetical protein
MMCRCWLCGPISHNDADFAVSFGSEDRLLNVCRYCEQDLELFGMRLNQIVRLEPSKPRRHSPLSLIVLGPVYSLLMEASS